MKTTFSLAEVAEQLLPPEWTDGERWLARRLNRGEIDPGLPRGARVAHDRSPCRRPHREIHQQRGPSCRRAARWPSAQMLAAIADALGVHVMDIDTAYEPRRRREACEDVPA